MGVAFTVGARQPRISLTQGIAMVLSNLDNSLVLAAPTRLVAETRVDFRCAALEHVGRMGALGPGALTIDLTQTTDLDASGLGILVLIQKRAREQGLVTRLKSASERIRNLLLLTRLDFLFEFVE